MKKLARFSFTFMICVIGFIFSMACETDPSCNCKPGTCGCEPGTCGCKPGACGCEPGTCECNPGCVCEPGACGGCKPGACECEPGTCECNPGCVCEPGACGCKPGACDCEPGTCECNPGCACEPGACGCKPGACDCEPGTCECKSGCGCGPGTCDCEPMTCNCFPGTYFSPAKFVFLFIGDGMGKNQAHAPELYGETVDFIHFPVKGLISTHDYNFNVTDSAAAGTALASGKKTIYGSLNINNALDPTVKFTTIAEYAHGAGMKVGILTTVTLTHATPAAFYGKSLDRWSGDNLADQLIHSGFDYFAGGNIVENNMHSDNFLGLAQEAGYLVVRSRDAFEDLFSASGKVIAIPPSNELHHEGSLFYEIDRDPYNHEHWTLSDITRKGIEVLHNPDGFFMMIESGKIDWACHNNDLERAIGEVIALDQAIMRALEFAAEYPDDTLIVVTADHETGGMVIESNSIHFTSSSHTGVPVPVYAFGKNASFFHGNYDNTDIFYRLARAMKLHVQCTCTYTGH